MCGVKLPPLVPEPSAHPLTQTTRPFRARFRQDSHVESHRRVDVPDTQRRDDQVDRDPPREKERWVEPNSFLVDSRGLIAPPENVVAPDEQDEKDQDESDR